MFSPTRTKQNLDFATILWIINAPSAVQSGCLARQTVRCNPLVFHFNYQVMLETCAWYCSGYVTRSGTSQSQRLSQVWKFEAFSLSSGTDVLCAPYLFRTQKLRPLTLLMCECSEPLRQNTACRVRLNVNLNVTGFKIFGEFSGAYVTGDCAVTTGTERGQSLMWHGRAMLSVAFNTWKWFIDVENPASEETQCPAQSWTFWTSEVGIWFNLKSPLKASLETGQLGAEPCWVAILRHVRHVPCSIWIQGRVKCGFGCLRRFSHCRTCRSESS